MRKFDEDERADIQASYRGAADQNQQIQILAQLYACSCNDIRGVLKLPQEKGGFEVFAGDVVKHNHKYSAATRNAAIKAVLEGGEKASEVAERLGVPAQCVWNWTYNARKKLAKAEPAPEEKLKPAPQPEPQPEPKPEPEAPAEAANPPQEAPNTTDGKVTVVDIVSALLCERRGLANGADGLQWFINAFYPAHMEEEVHDFLTDYHKQAVACISGFDLAIETIRKMGGGPA